MVGGQTLQNLVAWRLVFSLYLASMTTPDGFYSSQIDYYSASLAALRKKRILISILRLTSFIALAITLYAVINNYNALLATASFVLLVFFIVLIRLSLTITTKKKLTEQLLFINNNELNVIKDQNNAFPNGNDILDRPMHTDDLDIFGKGSLFHVLNRTTTIHGKDTLSALLNDPYREKQKIQLHQDAVKTLSAQPEKRQMILAHGLLQDVKDVNMEGIAVWITTDNRMAGKAWLNMVRILLPVFNLGAFLYYLDTDNPLPVGLGIVASWLITSNYISYITEQHNLTGKKQAILEQYAAILRQFSKTDPGSSQLIKELLNTAQEAHQQIFNLSKLTGMLDQRLNLLVNFFLNSFFIYDIQCMAELEKWKARNKNNFRNWMQAVGDIEALNSFSAFAFNNPGYCFPEITEGMSMINAKDAGHPLISNHAQVKNSIAAGNEEKLLLVTGSNMSGKSTFLRTIGVNILLAQCGAPVCASSFVFSPMKILSSVRISDSLQDNTSYFMAELKRLRSIINELEKGEPALVLIDEVLRGTNSDDKTHGSEAFIIKLLQYNCLAIFATHDLSLSELENTHAGVSNYCFESLIENGELSFDYKLRSGVATNKNASFLMEKMGII